MATAAAHDLVATHVIGITVRALDAGPPGPDTGGARRPALDADGRRSVRTVPGLSPRLAAIVDALPLRPDSRVLEIGCAPAAG